MKKGFTLIEVLIVIIIIGILATLLMPQMAQMAERARSAEAKNTMGAIRTLLLADRLETNAWPSTAATTDLLTAEIGPTCGPDARRLFEYATTVAVSTTEMVIWAQRNDNPGATAANPHYRAYMVCFADGSATLVDEYAQLDSIGVDDAIVPWAAP